MPRPPEPDPLLDTLATALGGSLVRPEDAEWDTARTPWNLSIDQRPIAVALPRDIDDLRHILSAARAGSYGVFTQPRGHGANTDLADCILVRTGAFAEVSVNVAERYARVGSGVTWGQLLPQLDGTGLIPLAGTNPEVSIAGYLLSGGHSWFSRWKGLAAHSIRAVELVDAQGAVHRITAQSSPDLLWAMRGAGGLFGIVTALEIDLYPAPELFGGKIVFPGDAAEVVFATVAAMMTDAPNELNIFLSVMSLPDLDMVPEPLRGQTVATADVVFVGSADEGRALLAPLLAAAPVVIDQTRTFTISQLGEVAAEPSEPSGGLDWTANIVGFNEGGLGDGGLTGLVKAFRAASAHGLTMLQLRPLGGAQANPGADASGVVGHLASAYLAYAGVFLTGAEEEVDEQAMFGPIEEAVRDRTVPHLVPSFLTPGQDLSDAFSPDARQRLAEIKRRVDPDNIFRSNRPLGAPYSAPAPVRRPSSGSTSDET